MGIDLDKLTRFTAWVFGEGKLAYIPWVSFEAPFPSELVIVRDMDGELQWDISDPGKQPTTVALGADGEVAVAYRIAFHEPEHPEAHRQVDLYDDGGNLLWTSKIVDGVDLNIFEEAESIRQLACDPDGNVFYVHGFFHSTRFGKLSHESGAKIFEQRDFSAPGEPTGDINSHCIGICCDHNGDVILGYEGDSSGMEGNPGLIGVRKRSGANGASLWTVPCTVNELYWSPRCDGDGNIFVVRENVLTPSNSALVKLNGTTGAQMAAVSLDFFEGAFFFLGSAVAIDDDGNVWVNDNSRSQLYSIDNNTITPIASGALNNEAVKLASEGIAIVLFPQAEPLSIYGYSFVDNGWTEAWRETHSFPAFYVIAQRFIGDV